TETATETSTAAHALRHVAAALAAASCRSHGLGRGSGLFGLTGSVDRLGLLQSLVLGERTLILRGGIADIERNDLPDHTRVPRFGVLVDLSDDLQQRALNPEALLRGPDFAEAGQMFEIKNRRSE